MRERRHPEDPGERLPQIGEGGAVAERHRPRAGPEHEQRHVLARMIGAGRGRIVAVVGGHDQQIVGPQARQQLRQPCVEALQVPGVAGHVVAVSVERVEVDQVGEHQARVAAGDQRLDGVHALVVAGGLHGWSMPRPANRSSIFPPRATGMPAADSTIEQGRPRAASARSRAGWRSA